MADRARRVFHALLNKRNASYRLQFKPVCHFRRDADASHARRLHDRNRVPESAALGSLNFAHFLICDQK
jgi:hypothetical protein